MFEDVPINQCFKDDEGKYKKLTDCSEHYQRVTYKEYSDDKCEKEVRKLEYDGSKACSNDPELGNYILMVSSIKKCYDGA